MGFTPAIQRGIFLTVEEGELGRNFVIGAAIRNPTEEFVELKTMSTKLFSVSLSQRTFTEEGTQHLWSPQTGAGQAVTRRRIKPKKTVVQTWQVPNVYQMYRRAREDCREYDFLDESDIGEWMEDLHPVNPNRVGVTKVKVGFPAPSGYFDTLTRQYDLRTSPERVLDDEIPDGDEDALDSDM